MTKPPPKSNRNPAPGADAALSQHRHPHVLRELDMLIARKFKAAPTVTQSRQVAMRLEITTVFGRQLFAVSIRQAMAVRDELTRALDQMQREAGQ